jgi:hypothetical protein
MHVYIEERQRDVSWRCTRLLAFVVLGINSVRRDSVRRGLVTLAVGLGR